MFMTTITDWLNQKFLEWQASQGRRKTISELAEYLDIQQPVLSHYLNGKHTPRGENVDKIALRFGNEIYAILGLMPPDPLYRQIVKNWEYYTDEQRRHISELLDQFEAENRTAAINARLDEIRAQLSTQANAETTRLHRLQSAHNLLDIIDQIPDFITHADPQTVNTALHALIKKIIVSPGQELTIEYW